LGYIGWFLLALPPKNRTCEFPCIWLKWLRFEDARPAYELFKGRKPNISYFHQFGCTCYILNNKVYIKKFDAKAQKGIFLGYSERSKAYRLYNSETLCVEELMHVKFDDKEPGDETP